jgi:putative DNA primase/helicase
MTDHFKTETSPASEAAASPPEADHVALIKHLASLAIIEYDQQRTGAAKQLGVKLSTLDNEVLKHRQGPSHTAEEKASILFSTESPCPGPVDGGQLLSGLVSALEHTVSVMEAERVAIALWIVYSHAFLSFKTSPRLALLSPEMRCGKTTLLKLLEDLVRKPLMTANISTSALFRLIAAEKPTFLIDEADTFFEDRNDLVGLINCGHSRGTTFIRNVKKDGEDWSPEVFDTFAPLVIAKIGELAPTIVDRSLVIRMRRKKPGELASPHAGCKPDLPVLKSMLVRWKQDNCLALTDCDLPRLLGLNDRAQDNWGPLLAIADRIGGEWSERARSAALQISADHESDSVPGTMLLADIRDIFSKQKVKGHHSEVLCSYLTLLQDRPWKDWKYKGITPRHLADLLRPYGIRPNDIRIGTSVRKGYEVEDFEDAFSRYLPPVAATPLQAAENMGPQHDSETQQDPACSATVSVCSASQDSANPHENSTCSAVAAVTPRMEEAGSFISPELARLLDSA